VHIETGQSYGTYDAEGRLLQPSPEVMARAAFRGKHVIGTQWYVPQISWVKDYPGQVTDGRVGRPAVEFAPLSWLGTEVQARVEALIAAQEAKEGKG
jgi:hypothetical protein